MARIARDDLIPDTERGAVMGRGKAAKTREIIETSVEILTESKFPLTIRRLYYELISKGVIENNAASYTSMVTKLTAARWDGDIPLHLLDKIIDGGREPLRVQSWASIAEFARPAANAYRRDRWENQAAYVELWVEKQAIVSLLEDVCRENHIVLRALHGFNSFTALHQTAKDLLDIHKNITIFYFGDHDPHGHEIEKDARERLCRMFDLLGNPAKRHAVEFRPRLGILPEDIGKFGILPLDVEELEKGGDSFKAKRDAFVEKYGNEAAEVDGLPAEELIKRLQDAIDDESCIDDRESWDNSLLLTESDRDLIRTRLDPEGGYS
jgi:hypothetical protein